VVKGGKAVARDASAGRTLEPAEDEDAWMPEPHLLRVESNKITGYLLNLDHRVGHGKAKFFRGVGFSHENLDEVVDAFRAHAAQNKIAELIESPHGVKTVIDCFMAMPSGKSYCIRAVWIDHLDGEPPRLATAHPLSA
jgi:hypothetical protein